MKWIGAKASFSKGKKPLSNSSRTSKPSSSHDLPRTDETMEVIIAPKARSDIASILAWTEESSGPQTLRRYGKLIATAIEQIAENPELAGSCQRPEIADNCRTYHLSSIRRASSSVPWNRSGKDSGRGRMTQPLRRRSGPNWPSSHAHRVSIHSRVAGSTGHSGFERNQPNIERPPRHRTVRLSCRGRLQGR